MLEGQSFSKIDFSAYLEVFVDVYSNYIYIKCALLKQYGLQNTVQDVT